MLKTTAKKKSFSFESFKQIRVSILFKILMKIYRDSWIEHPVSSKTLDQYLSFGSIVTLENKYKNSSKFLNVFIHYLLFMSLTLFLFSCIQRTRSSAQLWGVQRQRLCSRQWKKRGSKKGAWHSSKRTSGNLYPLWIRHFAHDLSFTTTTIDLFSRNALVVSHGLALSQDRQRSYLDDPPRYLRSNK